MIADIRDLLFLNLTPNERTKILSIQFFSLVSACLEATTIFAFYIIVGHLLEIQNGLADTSNIQSFMSHIPQENLALLLIGWIGFSAIISILSIFLINKQANNVTISISERLMKSFLSLSYSEYYRAENVEKIKITVAEVDRLGMGVILPLTIMGSRIFVALAILCSLLFVDIIMAISVMIIVGSLYVSFYLISKSRMLLNSDRVSAAIQNRFSISSKVFNGFEFLAVNRGFGDLFSDFQSANKSLSKARTENHTLGNIPRFFVELVFFIIAASVISFAQSTDTEFIRSQVPTLTAFCLGGLKLIPAAQAIFAQLAVIRTNFATIQDISSFFLEANKSTFKCQNYENINSDEDWLIKAEGLSLTFGDGSTGLADVDTEILCNRLNVLSGRSGAGKSTLLRIILNLEEPTSGKLYINKSKCSATGPVFEYVPQSVFIFDGTLRENLTFGRGAEISDQTLLEVLTKAALEEFFYELDDGFETELGDGGSKISGGQKQRIGIARALLGNPEMIILDEPTSALDAGSEELILKTLEKLTSETSIFVVSHSSIFRSNADCLIALEAGRRVN